MDSEWLRLVTSGSSAEPDLREGCFKKEKEMDSEWLRLVTSGSSAEPDLRRRIGLVREKG